MPELNFDELYINGIRYTYDPVNEEWFYNNNDRVGEQAVEEEINELLNYIQSIRIPKEKVESMKFLVDELKLSIFQRDCRIADLEDQVQSLETTLLKSRQD